MRPSVAGVTGADAPNATTLDRRGWSSSAYASALSPHPSSARPGPPRPRSRYRPAARRAWALAATAPPAPPPRPSPPPAAFLAGAQRGELLPAPIFLLALARLLRLEALAGGEPPVVDLHGGAADRPPAQTSSKGANSRQVSSPSMIARAMMLPAIAVVLRPWPPKPLASQSAGRQLADLRHAMERVAEHAGPDVLELDRRRAADRPPRCRPCSARRSAADRPPRWSSCPDHSSRSPPTMR